MKTLTTFLFLLISASAFGRTVFIDPLANLVYYSLKQDRVNNHFEKEKYNPDLKTLIKPTDHVIFITEFSSLGDLNLRDWSNANYYAPRTNLIDKLLLTFNSWGWVSQQDFFLTMDSITLNFFTTHPFFKKKKIEEIIKELPLSEEILVITTTWPTGEALYKSVLKEKKYVSYFVRDLHLKKTIYKTNVLYKFIQSQENTQYFVYDDPKSCLEAFDVARQAQLVISQELHVKTDAYIEQIDRVKQNVQERIKQYRASLGCLNP